MPLMFTVQFDRRPAPDQAAVGYRLAVALTVLLCAACGPPKDQQIRFRSQVLEHTGGDALQEKVEAAARQKSEVIDLIKSTPHDGGDISTGEWLERMMDAEPSGVMFDDWNVQRRAQNLYEVRFVYTAMDENHIISRRGYSWRVNSLLQTVNPPRELDFNDQDDGGGMPASATPGKQVPSRSYSLE